MPKKIKFKVLVFTNNPHPQSLANLVLMNKEYEKHDRSRNWRTKLADRHRIMRRLRQAGIPFTCVHCGRKKLDPFTDDKNKLATLDHVLPQSLGGSSEERNLAISCYRCNTRRGNTRLSPERIKEIRTVADLLAINVNSNTTLVLA